MLFISVNRILSAGEFMTDWSQFVPSVLATVIGFFLALVFQQGIYEILKSKILNRIKAKALITDIKKELERILNDLTGLSLVIDKAFFVDPIKTPVWEGILNTNEVELLARFKNVKLSKRILKDENLIKKYGAEELKNLQFNLYDMIFSVYGVVQDYNKWWYIYSENYAGTKAADGKDANLTDIKQCIKNIHEVLLNRTPQKKKDIGESVFLLANLIECTVNHKEYKNKQLGFDLSNVLEKK